MEAQHAAGKFIGESEGPRFQIIFDDWPPRVHSLIPQGLCALDADEIVLGSKAFLGLSVDDTEIPFFDEARWNGPVLFIAGLPGW